MSSTPTAARRPAAAEAGQSQARSTTLAAFLIGIPLAVALLLPLRVGPLAQQPFARYVQHNVECVEVILFCCALAALGTKALRSRKELAACATDLVPRWDGRPVPVEAAADLLGGLRRLARSLQETCLGRRVAGVLEFLCQRRSAHELDDHLRSLADNDGLAQENSYALTRFITWAIPILGFLGTVLGITEAIANVSPEALERGELSSVTNGLALAFDATALGLALTMITMFVSFLVERREQAVLEAVDAYVERQLAHRFLRAGADAAPVIAAVRENSQVLLSASDQLVRRQAEVWAQALAEVNQRAATVQAAGQEKLVDALETALARTIEAHRKQLQVAEQEASQRGAKLLEQIATVATAVRESGREQQAALARTAQEIAGHAAALGHLQEGGRQLAQLQTALQQNLAAVASAGNFENLLHSLTAAIHLLTARAGAPPALSYAPPPKPPASKAA